MLCVRTRAVSFVGLNIRFSWLELIALSVVAGAVGAGVDKKARSLSEAMS